MRPSPLRLLAALGLSAGLAACGTTKVPDAVADARTPTEQFKADVTSHPTEIRLAVHAQGVSNTQRAALADYIDAWRENRGGPISVQAPTGPGPDPAAAFRTADGVRALFHAEGVPERMVRLDGYDAAGAADAPIRISYMRYEVSIPQCGQKWTNMAHSATNEVQPNFGCAVTANMAAQIAEPADLVEARTMGPADAGRRQTVLEHYRKGEVTSATTDDKANGAVSRAVN